MYYVFNRLIMLTNKLLILFITFSIAFRLATGINFLPAILRSKLRSSIQFTSNQTNNKLWMKFLEKRLEMLISFSKNMNHINYILGFYEKIFAQKLFQVILSDCRTLFPEGIYGLQIGIYGTICSSSKTGKVQNIPDICLFASDFKICTKHKGKYS